MGFSEVHICISSRRYKDVRGESGSIVLKKSGDNEDDGSGEEVERGSRLGTEEDRGGESLSAGSNLTTISGGLPMARSYVSKGKAMTFFFFFAFVRFRQNH